LALSTMLAMFDDTRYEFEDRCDARLYCFPEPSLPCTPRICDGQRKREQKSRKLLN